jgi:excisionase family DNA binding protein
MLTTDRLLTVPQFAQYFGVSAPLTRRLIKSGELPAIKVGQRNRISLADARQWAASQRQVQEKRN